MQNWKQKTTLRVKKRVLSHGGALMRSFKELSLVSAILLVGQQTAFAASSPTPKVSKISTELKSTSPGDLVKQTDLSDEKSQAAKLLINSITVKDSNTVAYCLNGPYRPGTCN
jgi:hypothetical protein